MYTELARGFYCISNTHQRRCRAAVPAYGRVGVNVEVRGVTKRRELCDHGYTEYCASGVGYSVKFVVHDVFRLRDLAATGAATCDTFAIFRITSPVRDETRAIT